MPASQRSASHASSMIGAFRAKTHFSQLLERVAKGEEITITKHDRPVARLVPAERPSRSQIAEVFCRMDELRQSIKERSSKDKTNLKELINHGRRF